MTASFFEQHIMGFLCLMSYLKAVWFYGSLSPIHISTLMSLVLSGLLREERRATHKGIDFIHLFIHSFSNMHRWMDIQELDAFCLSAALCQRVQCERHSGVHPGARLWNHDLTQSDRLTAHLWSWKRVSCWPLGGRAVSVPPRRFCPVLWA